MSIGAGLEIVVAALGDEAGMVKDQAAELETMKEYEQATAKWVAKLYNTQEIGADVDLPYDTSYAFRCAVKAARNEE